MARYDDEDDISAYLSGDDEIPSSYKSDGGHSGGSRGYKLPRRSETYSSNPDNRRSGGERSRRTTSYDLDEDFDSSLQLSRRSETHSSNPDNRRSGGERSRRTTNYDLDEDFSSLQLSRRGGTDLSSTGNGRFGREVLRRRATYQPQADYDGGGRAPVYSPYSHNYLQRYGSGSHASGGIHIGNNSTVTIINYDRAPVRPKRFDSPEREIVLRERSYGKEREDFRDNLLPLGKKHKKPLSQLKDEEGSRFGRRDYGQGF